MLLSWDTANELVVSRKAESNGVGNAAATSRKAREVAHPQLFRSMLKDKPALYFPVEVAHPPVTRQNLTRQARDRSLIQLVAVPAPVNDLKRHQTFSRS